MTALVSKKCCKCLKEKSQQDFYKKDRRCKLCKKDASRKLYLENKVKRAEQSKKWRAANLDRHKALIKKWKEDNKEYWRAYNNERDRRRRKGDRVFAAKENMSRRLREALGSKKQQSTLVYLGCSLPFFREYIATRFTEGMSWDNYGKWHLDHIIPISAALTVAAVEKLSHYTNFQPLWAADNQAKSNKVYGKA